MSAYMNLILIFSIFFNNCFSICHFLLVILALKGLMRYRYNRFKFYLDFRGEKSNFLIAKKSLDHLIL